VVAHGVLALDMSTLGYAWRFIAVGGKILDRGSDVCR
jgi:hypothetical protein